MIPILRASDAGELKRRVMNRSQLQNEEVSRIVKEIVARVRQEGDAALFDYTAKFDHVTMTAETVLVTKDEIARAYAAASPEWLDAMREAARRITAFHEKQKQNTWLNFAPAISLGQKVTPLKRVGVYVPGGTAAYPSSVLMNVLPAKVAGVKEIIMVTPPGRDGSVSYPLALVAADLAGVDKIYKVGGAQAVAALAFGTESIPRVDKITGPGNIFVANAKREVFGHVGIDMVAGPSEVLVIADDSANPRYVAADPGGARPPRRRDSRHGQRNPRRCRSGGNRPANRPSPPPRRHREEPDRLRDDRRRADPPRLRGHREPNCAGTHGAVRC